MSDTLDRFIEIIEAQSERPKRLRMSQDDALALAKDVANRWRYFSGYITAAGIFQDICDGTATINGIPLEIEGG